MTTRALIVGAIGVMLIASGCEKAPPSSGGTPEPVQEQVEIDLCVFTDIANRPPREPLKVVLDRKSQITIRLVNDCDEPVRVLNTSPNLHCSMYGDHGLISGRRAIQLRQYDADDVQTLMPGEKIICHYSIEYSYLCWLEPGDYALQIRYVADSTPLTSEPLGEKPTNPTALALERWVNIKLVP